MTLNNKVNRAAITWGHAVNSQREVKDILNSDINMIETDVVLGQLNNTGPNIPILAHPPVVSSDISLEQLLSVVLTHNEANSNNVKGVKLDFKSIEVFESSLGILNEMMSKINFPIWLNADIIGGPVHADTKIVDAERFLAGCKQFKEAVLSIGWTTHWGANYRDGEYTTSQLEEMLQAINTNKITETGHPITFPVRAGIAANSRAQLHELLRKVNESNDGTITIWTSRDDYVNVEKLRQLISELGVDRVYVDVPDELLSQLNLERRDNGEAML